MAANNSDDVEYLPGVVPMQAKTAAHHSDVEIVPGGVPMEAIRMPIPPAPKGPQHCLAQGMLFSAPGTTKKRYVFLGCRIIQVGEINLRQQLWKVRFDLFCEWMHPVDSREDPRRLNDWQPTWEPLLRFTNADEFDATNKMYMTFPNTGFVGYRVTVSGHFRMDSDLTSFPFDVQALPITITMGREKYSRHLLHHEVAQFQDAANHANIIMAQSSDEYRFRPLRYSLSKTSRSEGVDGQAMSQWTVVAPVRRISFYYIINYYMVAAIIELLTLAMFYMKPSDDRIMLVVTIFVVMAAFKMQMSGEIPRVPKMTHLDKYVICSFAWLFVMFCYSFHSVWKAGFDEEWSEEEWKEENTVFWCSIAVWTLQQVLFWALARYYISLWPKQLNTMGALDPQALFLMEKDGFDFKNGALVGDLDFTKAAEKRSKLLALQKSTIDSDAGNAFQNTQDWPVLGDEDETEDAVRSMECT